ncbi:MAG: hypothetical protein JRE38_14765 [Deltaproteobacteria bacterium]|nr:hypothetical protein [Deltaproteobacteria bacterium]
MNQPSDVDVATDRQHARGLTDEHAKREAEEAPCNRAEAAKNSHRRKWI